VQKQNKTKKRKLKFTGHTCNSAAQQDKILPTDRQKEAVIPGESKTLDCPLVVGDGAKTSSILNIPNADEASATATTASCRCQASV